MPDDRVKLEVYKHINIFPIMKVSKVFGCVLGLHVGVISILLVQSGCQTTQPPTQTYTQGRTAPVDRSATPALSSRTSPAGAAMRSTVPGASRSDRGLIEATRAGDGAGSGGLDAAFNAGFDNEDFSEFDDVAPIKPLARQGQSGQSGQSIRVAGESLETYTVKRGDNLWTIAKRNNVSLDELYAANGLDKNSVLRVGQEIQIPVQGSTAQVDMVEADSYQPTSYDQESTTYTVKRGDTLSKIANQYGTTVNAIKGANDKSSDMIRVGESLVIPVSGSGSGASSRNASGSAATRASPTSTTSSLPTPSNSTNGSRTHTVKAGEFPATIARQYGMTTGELLALNGITDPRKLQVGQQLRVSGSGSAQNVDSRTETLVSPSVAPAPGRQVSSPQSTNSTRPAATRSQDPVEIQIIEADPMVEGEISDVEADAMFEGAVEIPVIRMEE